MESRRGARVVQTEEKSAIYRSPRHFPNPLGRAKLLHVSRVLILGGCFVPLPRWLCGVSPNSNKVVEKMNSDMRATGFAPSGAGQGAHVHWLPESLR